MSDYNLIESIALGLGAGLVFTLALALMSRIREELEFARYA